MADYSWIFPVILIGGCGGSMVGTKACHDATRGREIALRRSELIGQCRGEKRFPITADHGDVYCIDDRFGFKGDAGGVAWRKSPDAR